MANTSSAKRQSAPPLVAPSSTSRAAAVVKTSVRLVEEAIAKGDRSAAEAALKAAQPQLVRAANKNVMHKHAASRKISRLARRVKAIGA